MHLCPGHMCAPFKQSCHRRKTRRLVFGFPVQFKVSSVPVHILSPREMTIHMNILYSRSGK